MGLVRDECAVFWLFSALRRTSFTSQRSQEALPIAHSRFRQNASPMTVLCH